MSGSPASLQNASHSITGDYVVDHWTTGDRNFELRTLIRRQVSAIDSPVLTLADLSVELTAHYATPQPVLQYDFDGLKPGTVHEHTVVLAPRRALTSTSPLQQRTLSRSNLTVQTWFYWPAPPSKGIGEKTAPLIQWKETRIEGLTSNRSFFGANIPRPTGRVITTLAKSSSLSLLWKKDFRRKFAMSFSRRMYSSSMRLRVSASRLLRSWDSMASFASCREY